MVDSIPSTTAAASQTTSSSDSTGALTGAIGETMGKEDFLNLLVTQLRYQDPMSPEDPKDFVAQLAQFSSLEQQINVNQQLEDLSELLKTYTESQNMAQGVSLLGKTVTGSGNQITVAGGEAAEASFQLPSDAQALVVGIFDANGEQVRLLNLGAQSSGTCTFTWDGKDRDGNQIVDGTYSYQVAAQDKDGQALQVDTHFTGTVEEVYQDSQGIWVKVDGRQVLLSSIVSVADTN
ncbi:MAG: flagellar hook assembly protein FlgD [Syntrophobacterales bacterium]|jgi:flagellar basal-body rod modification protein FlgD